ncbi:bifunctional hydroxymethylpyrimidine kinase/phosphomethylpyrimidine kinase [Rhodococcus sp. BP-252]|uniref:1-phosphofructokinase family hexose kinase n=1 Tax=unclassified Rhodococcus (in: high G+C Gram-positive bacteria) TaxID=192944 RepID=UPI0014300CC0|nr:MULTISPECIES: PfkB family carbohydrate kinase [unclassified Rhodococcus (in: high G+C Gram-positive bacteria)]MBY6410215.1 bifunctional hydroxymethylpyrimidine kinase/phosphomethylpyrimidine kinase [Rhodococcus sp. BP-320]MBY6415184.1 bifunctional hydroxymethylpyrimidine kinase/phosphomethylpyrimidine kinase [Rhodococcus sp. BP-321]MBY6421507.1 bifunctional hydroxymethylpyrimidine kinase/phosphomethylpyrimidine kinase [Rhodococcus sp. BP-324]MBY6425508.1 bifunctional hydroxymethylpyrimidine 
MHDGGATGIDGVRKVRLTRAWIGHSVSVPDIRESPTAFVFAPSPLLTVTLDCSPSGDPELHVHAGGQGHWISRMASVLGLDVTLCGVFGGEIGGVLRDLIEREGIKVEAVEIGQESGSYVHDRRDGERKEVATVDPPPLARHALDDLFGLSLAVGSKSDIAILGGPHSGNVVPPELYTRLAADLTALGVPIVADLSGPTMTAALAGGLTVLKVSHEDLIEDGRADSEEPEALIEAMRALHDEGAQVVVISRAAEPALALVDDEVLEIVTPDLSQVDHHGAGDSMSAGIATGLARGMSMRDALQLGGGAGSANVTRRGLGSGQRDLVLRLTEAVDVRTFGSAS